MNVKREDVKRRLIRLMRMVLLVFLGLCIVLYALQTKMIFPGAETQGQRHAVVRAGPHEELIELKTADGTLIVALFGHALASDGTPLPDAKSRPTILFFYGNGMCLADCAGEFRKFQRLGANVMIPDFAGYGMSGGAPSAAGVLQTADAAYEHLIHRGDIDAKKVFPVGWSLGAAGAIHIAATRPVAGLITLSAFTSLREMAHNLLPFLPTSVLLRHHLENEQKIADVKCPILMFHGRRDSIIPFWMSQRLESAAKAPVTRIAIDEADHNDIFEVC
jgi:fermentation-respiration switch protein FrsA (DUF1100 family)